MIYKLLRTILLVLIVMMSEQSNAARPIWPLSCLLRTVGYYSPYKILSAGDQFKAKYFISSDVKDQKCFGTCNTFSFSPIIEYAAGEPISRDYLEWIIMVNKLRKDAHVKNIKGDYVSLELSHISDVEVAATIDFLNGVAPKGKWYYKNGFSGLDLQHYFESFARRAVKKNNGEPLTDSIIRKFLDKTASKFFFETSKKNLIPIEKKLIGDIVYLKDIKALDEEIIEPLKHNLSLGKPQRIWIDTKSLNLKDKYYKISKISEESDEIDHAVAVIGYTEGIGLKKEPAFIIQNSWGSDTGYKGTLYLTIEELRKIKEGYVIFHDF